MPKQTFRNKLKEELVAASNGKPMCALCGSPASQMHEIVYIPLEGGKYNPKDTPLARAIYAKENVLLLCASCNVIDANSLRDNLIRHNMATYGSENIISLYREMAKLLKSPRSWIPESVEYWGEWVKIL